jgi:hypothetical protein
MGRSGLIPGILAYTAAAEQSIEGERCLLTAAASGGRAGSSLEWCAQDLDYPRSKKKQILMVHGRLLGVAGRRVAFVGRRSPRSSRLRSRRLLQVTETRHRLAAPGPRFRGVSCALCRPPQLHAWAPPPNRSMSLESRKKKSCRVWSR